MSPTGLIGFVCGRRGTWLVVALWLVLLVVAAPLVSKLTGAKDTRRSVVAAGLG